MTEYTYQYVYNELENLSEIWYNYADGTREKAYSYEYTGAGQLYCFNNPIAYTDSTGNWPDWVKVEDFIYDTFGVAVVQSQEYDILTVDTLLYGTEMGVCTTAVIDGDSSKTISIYATNASEWWKLWEY